MAQPLCDAAKLHYAAIEPANSQRIKLSEGMLYVVVIRKERKTPRYAHNSHLSDATKWS